MAKKLTDAQTQRYIRQTVLPNVGEAGQLRLLESSALIVGAGGLGSPCSIYLAAAGVGCLGLLDSDTVDVSNLHRQILHDPSDVGRPKTESGFETLKRLDADIHIIPIDQRLSAQNVDKIIADYDIVIDGSDNFATKFLLNDACVLGGKTLIHGGVFQFGGQLMTILPFQGPCYRCVFDEPPPDGAIPTCEEAGILGVIPGVIGLLQATEAIKYLLKLGDPLIGRMMVYDALEMRFRDVPISRNPDCPICGENPTITQIESI